MKKKEIKQLIENRIKEDGIVETGIEGVQLFRGSEAMKCAPVVYNPTVVAIINGKKEAILDGHSYLSDNNHYMCCTISIPLEVGTPSASPGNPLLGVLITLDTKLMTELVFEMASVSGAIRTPKNGPIPFGISAVQWDTPFTDALLQLLLLDNSATDAAILGESRLRELYYTILKGDAGASVKRSFGAGNEIAKSIEYLSFHLDEAVTIDRMAKLAGMSRAVYHRKFKQATKMSPIQFVKSMKLNNAAMKMASGMNVNEAAMSVGYVSPSQFSREFKRLYGKSPKKWHPTTQFSKYTSYTNSTSLRSDTRKVL